MKIIKLSAVTPGVCNFTVDEDVDKFIKTILDKEHKKMDKEIKTPNTYVKTLANYRTFGQTYLSKWAVVVAQLAER